MSSNQFPLLRHLRSWRNPPGLDQNPEEERRANWLELFYDLVYIATVIQLGTYLHHHLTVTGALQYGFLFLIVWWSWSGTTYYGNRFVTDDALHRLLVFVQIFAVGNLAVSIPTAFGAGGATFALSYVALRVLLVLMYARAYRHERDVRPLIRNYVTGFSLGILFWLVSAFVPPPWRYALWGLGIGAEVLVHFAFGTQRFEQRVPFNLSHLSERYALFIIIVLGDTFIKAIGRVAEEGITTNTNLFGALGVLMAVSLWWVYFDDVAGAALRQGYETLTWWVYAHLPLSATLVAFGVAAEDITQLEPDQALEPPLLWLLCLSTGLYFASVAWVDLLTETRTPQLGLTRVAMRAASAVLLLLLALLGGGLLAPPLVGVVAALCAAQILFDLLVGRERAEVGELSKSGQD